MKRIYQSPRLSLLQMEIEQPLLETSETSGVVVTIEDEPSDDIDTQGLDFHSTWD